MGYANGRFFVVDRSDDKLHAGTGERDAPGDCDLDEDNPIPVGIACAGGRFCVLGRGAYRYPAKVYACSDSAQPDASLDLVRGQSQCRRDHLGRGPVPLLDSNDSQVHAYALAPAANAAGTPGNSIRSGGEARVKYSDSPGGARAHALAWWAAGVSA